MRYLFIFLFVVIVILHYVIYSELVANQSTIISTLIFGELMGIALALTAIMSVLNIIAEEEPEEEEEEE